MRFKNIFKGRFDLYSTSFRCISCNSTREATNEEYMSSDFWPGSLSNNTYFFDGQLLKLWYHLRNKTPGTSERKFIEALEEVYSVAVDVSTNTISTGLKKTSFAGTEPVMLAVTIHLECTPTATSSCTGIKRRKSE